MKLHGTHLLNRAQIDELITSGLNLVHFSSPTEQLYRTEYKRAAAKEFRYRAPMIFFLYGFLTYGVYQNFSNQELAIEWFKIYAWVGIIIGTAWVISLFRRFDRFFDLYTSLGCTCAVAITFWLINSSSEDGDKALLHAAMMYAVVIIYSFVGMRFYTALIAGWMGGIIGSFASHFANYEIDWNYLSHTYVFSSFLGMSLAYAIDRQHRENYLQNCIIEIKQHEIQAQSDRLEQLSFQDPLTALANRRYLNQKLEEEWAWAIFHQEPITLIMLDIDYFKNYNDTLGHVAGDACLQAIASVLKVITTNHPEVAARYGGEEFLLVFPSTAKIRAKEITQLIIDNIRQLKIGHPDSPIDNLVTVSIGTLTTIPNEHDSLYEFIENVDKALYEAKKKGRNCFEIGDYQNAAV